MTPFTFAVVVFLTTLAAVWLGLQSQRFLPDAYTDQTTRASVKAVFGMLSVLVTIVLGFITADAKNSFDNAARIVSKTAVRLMLIDRILAGFGDDGAPIRRELKQAAQGWIARINSAEGDALSSRHMRQRGEYLEELFERIESLVSKSDADAKDHERAMDLADEILQDRWVLATERVAATPTVFLVVLLAWLALEFFLFGIFASRNAFVASAVVFAALTIASAMFLVLDLEGPVTGAMRISTRPLELAVSLMGA